MENTRKGAHKPLILIVGAIVVVAIITVAVFFMSMQGNKTASTQASGAKEACSTAFNEVRVATNQYNALLNGDANDALKLTEADVTDASTLKALQSEAEADTPDNVACIGQSDEDLNKSTEQLKTNAQWYKDHTASLQKAVDAVQAVKK